MYKQAIKAGDEKYKTYHDDDIIDFLCADDVSIPETGIVIISPKASSVLSTCFIIPIEPGEGKAATDATSLKSIETQGGRNWRTKPAEWNLEVYYSPWIAMKTGQHVELRQMLGKWIVVDSDGYFTNLHTSMQDAIQEAHDDLGLELPEVFHAAYVFAAQEQEAGWPRNWWLGERE